MRQWITVFVAAWLSIGCVSPPPPSEMASDAARDLNLAARFGQLGVAATHAAESERAAFLERRAEWGRTLRIVDTELAGFEMSKADNAKVFVDITWLRQDELSVRSTRVAQYWRDHRVGGWLLVREKRVDGDLGLFGEAVERSPERAKDVHFPTKVIAE